MGQIPVGSGNTGSGNPPAAGQLLTRPMAPTEINASRSLEDTRDQLESVVRSSTMISVTSGDLTLTAVSVPITRTLTSVTPPAGTAPAQPAQTRKLGHFDQKKQDKMNEQLRKADEYDAQAKLLEEGSEERKELLKKKEKAQVEANSYRKELKIGDIENEAERERELSTFKRHKRYDALKKIFYKPSEFAREDAEYTKPAQGTSLARKFKNIGRAFFGGTKPMYRFKEEGTGQEYLYKEAVNCLGMEKTSGAIVTEAASKLQRQVCGDQCYIEAFATRNAEGKVVGSLQKKVDQVPEDQRFDLFSWQAHPETTPLPDALKKEILREHTLDWLLCNFDTKGENFLHQSTTDGQQLCSFDKEASFSFLEDEGSQHMSTDYKPHSNDTLYNVVFTQFAEGKLDLNLQDALAAIERTAAIDDDEYMANFEEVLRTRYSDESERAEARAKILARKTNLVTEYRQFFTGLLERRRAALEADGRAFDHDADLQDGKFRFANTRLEQPDWRDPDEIEISEPTLVSEQHFYAGYGTTPKPELAGTVNRDRKVGDFWINHLLHADSHKREGAVAFQQRLDRRFGLGGDDARNASGTKNLKGLNLHRHIMNMMEYLGEGKSEDEITAIYEKLSANLRVGEDATQDDIDAADAQFDEGIEELKKLYYVQLKRMEANYGTLITQMHPEDFLKQIDDMEEFSTQFGIIQDLMIMMDQKADFGLEDPQSDRDKEIVKLAEYYTRAYMAINGYGGAAYGYEVRKESGSPANTQDFANVKQLMKLADPAGVGGPCMDKKQLAKYQSGLKKRAKSEGWEDKL